MCVCVCVRACVRAGETETEDCYWLKITAADSDSFLV